jgi:hypothetical protein
VSRGGVLLAVALTLVLSPAAAAGQSGAQPDLIIVGRDGSTLTGDDVYDTGTGQQRSVIVDDRVEFTIRIENDGDHAEDYGIIGTVLTGRAEDFRIRYRVGSAELQTPFSKRRFSARVKGLEAGAARDLHIVVQAIKRAPLGSTIRLDIYARPPRHGVPENDTVWIDVTKTSKAE